MSKRKGEGEEEAGPSKKVEKKETTSEKVFLPRLEQQYAVTEAVPGQMPSTSRPPGEMQRYPAPHPPLRVKRPGRPRIHPPKPVGISKPRGRPRGSKNKKPRKRRDAGAKLVERPPKRPRGRPRKWPPEMWEGFQRSQFAAVSQQIQQQMQRQQPPPPQEVAGPSHSYYEEHLQQQIPASQEEISVPPPLSHLPFHIVSQETPELPHLMHMPQQHQPLPQQQPLHIHGQAPQPHPLHPQQQEEHMLLLQPLYLQEHEQQSEQMILPQEEHPYYQEQMPHPPRTTS